jgi:uncharacterized cofD-like protein
MTEHGETDNFKASDHVRVIVNTLGKGILDYAVVNTRRFSPETLKRYEQAYSYPVEGDISEIEKMGVKVLAGEFAKERGGLIRHDPEILSEVITKLARKKV